MLRVIALLLVGCVGPPAFTVYGIKVYPNGQDVKYMELKQAVDVFAQVLAESVDIYTERGVKKTIIDTGITLELLNEPIPCTYKGQMQYCSGMYYFRYDKVMYVVMKPLAKKCFGLSSFFHELIHAVSYEATGDPIGKHDDNKYFILACIKDGKVNEECMARTVEYKALTTYRRLYCPEVKEIGDATAEEGALRTVDALYDHL